MYSKYLGLTISIILILTLNNVYAENKKLYGNKPYTPTRLEWLSLELNANYKTDLTSESKFYLGFVPIEKEDTIVIFVRYMPDCDREILNSTIENVRSLVEKTAKGYGWDKWLKVREQVEMSKSRLMSK